MPRLTPSQYEAERLNQSGLYKAIIQTLIKEQGSVTVPFLTCDGVLKQKIKVDVAGNPEPHKSNWWGSLLSRICKAAKIPSEEYYTTGSTADFDFTWDDLTGREVVISAGWSEPNYQQQSWLNLKMVKPIEYADGKELGWDGNPKPATQPNVEPETTFEGGVPF